jgi:hypothetical protein
MPFINGRYYINPTFGRGIELARMSEGEQHAADGESVYAAHRAGKQPDPTNGAKHFYLEYGQGPPRWATGQAPTAVFGPFSNPTGKGDAAKDKDVRIVVLP